MFFSHLSSVALKQASSSSGERERGLGWAELGWCLGNFWQGWHVLRARTESRALGEPCYPTFICQCKYFVKSEGGRKKDGKL